MIYNGGVSYNKREHFYYLERKKVWAGEQKNSLNSFIFRGFFSWTNLIIVIECNDYYQLERRKLPHGCKHLFFTDCHFEKDTIIDDDRINSITTILNNDSNENICLAFSGDLAQGGKNNEYESFMLFLELILEKVKKKISFVCCPGNHDILRSEEEVYSLDDLISDSKSKEIIKNHLNSLSEYYAFQRAETKLIKLTDFIYKQVIEIEKNEIVVYSLNNVVLTCYGGGYSSDSTYGHAHISEEKKEKSALLY